MIQIKKTTLCSFRYGRKHRNLSIGSRKLVLMYDEIECEDERVKSENDNDDQRRS
jgi:hypothetical protein